MSVGDEEQMDLKRSTVRDLRRHNRSALLTKLFQDGPLSRHELSGPTGLSAATVSNVIGGLIDEGLVVEAGMVDSDGGRPRVLLRVNPEYGHVVGVDVGETGIKVELFDLSMSRLSTVDHPLPEPRPQPEVVAERIAAGLREVTAAAGLDQSGVMGMGIGVPGTVEQSSPVRVHAPTLGWDAVALGKLLASDGVTVPLFFENGAKTLGQAEMWFGAGRGARYAVITLVGSGIGAAVISDGQIYRGATSSAGEWGHTTVVHGGRSCRCGSRGCLEAYAGAEAILERYQQARRGRRNVAEDEQTRLAALLAARSKSAVADRILLETAEYLGAGIANLVNLFNPERIVLGGWAGLALGEQLLPEIRRSAEEHALAHPYGQTTIELCELGQDAVAVGAATLPVADLLRAGGRSAR
ncbi:ROK family transcriptional regulator [Fodinicola acaciae]|uniref:ROK family transcriptional regulator n=1 Tax=Fodinicola acaciae TaxID=2681555 RepID=UPI001C9E5AC0|nr:ROK family transcriptional regulator [Fodinicola acaciae]